jgi:hypothetical protein
MRRFILTVLLLTAAHSAFAGPRLDQVAVHTYQKAYGQEPVNCSATVIGPYALLTASHCEMATDIITVESLVCAIALRIRDGQDHTIYLLDDMEEPFPVAAHLLDKPFYEGEAVYLRGNPGGRVHLYRQGIFSGYVNDTMVKQVMMFELPVYRGDSGSGVFTEDGSLRAVLSFDLDVGDPDKYWSLHFAQAAPLDFSAEQLDAALTYKSRKPSDRVKTLQRQAKEESDALDEVQRGLPAPPPPSHSQ